MCERPPRKLRFLIGRVFGGLILGFGLFVLALRYLLGRTYLFDQTGVMQALGLVIFLAGSVIITLCADERPARRPGPIKRLSEWFQSDPNGAIIWGTLVVVVVTAIVVSCSLNPMVQ